MEICTILTKSRSPSAIHLWNFVWLSPPPPILGDVLLFPGDVDEYACPGKLGPSWICPPEICSRSRLLSISWAFSWTSALGKLLVFELVNVDVSAFVCPCAKSVLEDSLGRSLDFELSVLSKWSKNGGR